MPATSRLLLLFVFGLLARPPATGAASQVPAAGGPHQFVYFGADRERIADPAFLETPVSVGAQLRYSWRELEPTRDHYAFEGLLKDLTFLEAHGRRLFVQIQDVSFGEHLPVPDYLLAAEFGAGAARKYQFAGDDPSKPVFDGWVARRWDPRVIARFASLLQALGRQVDGRVEGINLAESAVGFGTTPPLRPEGFTFAAYADGVKAIMAAARAAFPRSVVIEYANFMPGEWLPWEDHGYLRGIYAYAARVGVGVGGPDLLPGTRGQQNHCLKLIAARGPGVVAGLAVQDGNLAQRNPATGRRVTAEELLAYARDALRLDYLFWGTEEPYYTGEVLPLLRRLAAGAARQ